ncbi:hypothetical protein EV424DRAFT_1345105, partial [Suillus variegatus]
FNARLTSVEMVIAITALRKCELRIVQSSLIGSILSKLLLVLGMCFFAGGLRFSEQGFDQSEVTFMYPTTVNSSDKYQQSIMWLFVGKNSYINTPNLHKPIGDQTKPLTQISPN